MLEEKKEKYLKENEQMFKLKRKESRLANNIDWINKQKEIKAHSQIELKIVDRKEAKR